MYTIFLKQSFAVHNNRAKRPILVCILEGTQGSLLMCWRLGSWVARPGKTRAVRGGDGVTKAASGRLSLRSATCGHSAWHREKADRSGLCQRRRWGGTEGGWSCGSFSGILLSLSSTRVEITIGCARIGMVRWEGGETVKLGKFHLVTKM